MKYLNKIIEYGLYLLVFVLPVQTRWIIRAGELNGGYWEYGALSLYATDALLIIVLLFFIINLFFKKRTTSYKLSRLSVTPPRRWQATSYWFYIIIIDVAIFISIFFAQDIRLAIYNYIRFLLGVGLFWLIVNAEYNRIKLIWSFVAGATVQACLGIWQFLTQSSFSNKWLGMAAHQSGDLGVSVIETLGGERWLRAYGGLDHPNILGGTLVVTLLLLMILYLDKKNEECEKSDKIFPAIAGPRQGGGNFSRYSGTPPRRWQSSISQSALYIIHYMLRVTCYALCVVALFFTFSRSAWLGLISGLSVMTIMVFVKKDLFKKKKLLEIILTGGLIIFILFNLYGSLVLTRLSGEARLEIKSTNERVESLKYACEIIKNNWLFGVGIGNYTLYRDGSTNNPPACKRLERQRLAGRPNPLYQGGGQPVHNTFLLVWAETGILGLIGFLGFLLCVMCYMLREKKNGEKTLNVMLSFSVLTALIAMMSLDHWWWSLHFGVLFLFLILGLELREKKA